MSLTFHKNVLRDTDTGDTVELRQIGKGAFAVAYEDVRLPDRIFVIVRDCKQEFSKELLARIWEDGNGNPHLPYVRRAGSLPDAEVYVMPRYTVPLRASQKEAWKQYRHLEGCWHAQDYITKMHGHTTMNRVVECAEGDVPDKLHEALQTLRDYAADYGDDYTFEFAPRNLGTDAKGNLILLDVVFGKKALYRVQEGRAC